MKTLLISTTCVEPWNSSILQGILSKEEVEEQCCFLRHVWRDRIFTPMVTLWTFLAQVLEPDSACKKAVARVAIFLSVTKG